MHVVVPGKKASSTTEFRRAAGRDVRGSLRSRAVSGGGSVDGERRGLELAADRARTAMDLLRQRETRFRNVAAALTAEKRLRRRERKAAELVALVEHGKADKSGLRRRR